jgi:tetratricopeptide (TPR) repeat protein
MGSSNSVDSRIAEYNLGRHSINGPSFWDIKDDRINNDVIKVDYVANHVRETNYYYASNRNYISWDADEAASKLNDDGMQSVYNGRFQEAQRKFDTAYKINGGYEYSLKNKAMKYATEGEIFLKKKDYLNAIDKFGEACRLDFIDSTIKQILVEQIIDVANKQGMSSMKINNFSDAEKLFYKAYLQIPSTNKMGHFFLIAKDVMVIAAEGQSLYDKQMYSSAMNRFQKARDTYPISDNIKILLTEKIEEAREKAFKESYGKAMENIKEDPVAAFTEFKNSYFLAKDAQKSEIKDQIETIQNRLRKWDLMKTIGSE